MLGSVADAVRPLWESGGVTMIAERTIDAAPERIFALLADHANYRRFPFITGSALVRAGRDEPDGVGAVRRISIGPTVFVEEITRFDRPHRMDYRITRVNLPLRHDGATILLTETARGTTVRWSSAMFWTVPAFGPLLDRLAKPLLDHAFGRVLAALDRELTSR